MRSAVVQLYGRVALDEVHLVLHLVDFYLIKEHYRGYLSETILLAKY